MSKQTIRAKIVSRTGQPVSDSDDRALIDVIINDSAEELYRENDLVGALKEYILNVPDVTTRLISLPTFIQDIRGLRWYDIRNPDLKLATIHQRYQDQGIPYTIFNWRDLGNSPLRVQITNSSTLTFQLPLVEETDITISITGSTPNSNHLQEDVVIPAGQLEVETANDWLDVKSISKSVANTYNIKVLDADGVELSLFSNNDLVCLYKIIQINDDNVMYNNQLCSGIEVLYKQKFSPMANDSDIFLDGRYDDAVYWKYLEEWFSRQEGGEQDAILASEKATQVVSQVAVDANTAKDMNMKFVENPYYGMFGSNYTCY